MLDVVQSKSYDIHRHKKKWYYQQAVEMNSRRAFSESNIGGWDYLRNMVQLPFYLQNSALRRVKSAQQTASRRMLAHAGDELAASLQRSVSIGSFLTILRHCVRYAAIQPVTINTPQSTSCCCFAVSSTKQTEPLFSSRIKVITNSLVWLAFVYGSVS